MKATFKSVQISQFPGYLQRKTEWHTGRILGTAADPPHRHTHCLSGAEVRDVPGPAGPLEQESNYLLGSRGHLGQAMGLPTHCVQEVLFRVCAWKLTLRLK